ncbi:PilW family protein [Pseudomonas hunanensis]|uniref:PilW family protein n=1 Tax=Pseudomonas hunanensis TaxID=1247546 RepID=UPI002404EC08|nr:hypothetical protein [Pseudomonas hunanensis]MDF9753474.1 Flp pilus assembly pilin Flp [Pseudomonas hunanensis]
MKRGQAGAGLVEVLLAVALGALLLVAAGQLFGQAYQAWRLQGAVARLQDDARLVLQRLAEDIRMAGMFGCLRLEAADFADPQAALAFARPIEVNADSLTLVGAELPGLLGAPDWTVLTDCRSWARVQRGQHVPGDAQLALPVRRGYLPRAQWQPDVHQQRPACQPGRQCPGPAGAPGRRSRRYRVAHAGPRTSAGAAPCTERGRAQSWR